MSNEGGFLSIQRTLLAAALQSRAGYEAISAGGETGGFTGPLADVWAATAEWYANDAQASRVDAELLAEQVATRANGPKHAKSARELVRELAAQDVSVANVAEYVRAAGLERLGHELAAKLVSGRAERDELLAKLDEYRALHETGSADAEIEDEWRGLIQRRVDPAKKWRVTPKALNDVLGGGVLPGHNITIFARPEAGKTALALTMACGFARRGKRVLYVGNEESVDDLRVRAMCNLLTASAAELLEDPASRETEAIEKGASNLFFRELAPGTVAELERLVRALKPNVLVVDQLRNLRVKSDNFTQQLDKAAQAIRALGKRYALVTISVTQAGDSARDKPVLDDGDIDSSNTGIPGAADVLIGMGVHDGLRSVGQRVLSLCKNKVSARHEHFTVYLDEPFSKVRS